MSTEKVVLSNLIHSENYARKVVPYIKSEYFSDNSEKLVFEMIDAYWGEYNRPPSKVELETDLKKKQGIGEDIFSSSLEIISELNRNVVDNEEWLINTTEKFCQDKAVYNAILKSIEIIDNKGGDLDSGSIPDILSKALAVSFDSHIGHDYIEDAEDRWKFYHTLERRIPFDLEYFNKITKGGVVLKSLNVVLMETGGGKSMFMCHTAAANLLAGYNVLYLTMEMSEEKIAERIDANLLNIDISEIPMLDLPDYLKKFDKIKQKVKGKLVIKEYPSGQAHANHFRYAINELKLKKGFVPDVIFVDYLGICASSRLKRANSNSYEYGKAVAEELRALAQEFNLAVWTAIQTNRGGLNNSDVDLTNTSECIYVDEILTLKDGSKKIIGDVKLGDQIISNDNFKTVTMVHHKKIKECYRITLESGKSIIVSADHKFPSSAGRKSINMGLSVGHILKTRQDKSPVIRI